MPNYDINCPNCGVRERINVPISRRADPCEVCGAQVDVLITAATKSSGFEPYFDICLGEYVTGHGDINKLKRENNLKDRDRLSKGEMSARMDRLMERKKRQMAASRR